MGSRFTPAAKSSESFASHSRTSRAGGASSSSASHGMSPEHMLELQSQVGNQQTMAMAQAPGSSLPHYDAIQKSFAGSGGDMKAPDSSASIQAEAYAQGSDIHVGSGQEKHLPHEAWHVVQQ